MAPLPPARIYASIGARHTRAKPFTAQPHGVEFAVSAEHRNHQKPGERTPIRMIICSSFADLGVQSSCDRSGDKAAGDEQAQLTRNLHSVESPLHSLFSSLTTLVVRPWPHAAMSALCNTMMTALPLWTIHSSQNSAKSALAKNPVAHSAQPLNDHGAEDGERGRDDYSPNKTFTSTNASSAMSQPKHPPSAAVLRNRLAELLESVKEERHGGGQAAGLADSSVHEECEGVKGAEKTTQPQLNKMRHRRRTPHSSSPSSKLESTCVARRIRVTSQLATHRRPHRWVASAERDAKASASHPCEHSNERSLTPKRPTRLR